MTDAGVADEGALLFPDWLSRLLRYSWYSGVLSIPAMVSKKGSPVAHSGFLAEEEDAEATTAFPFLLFCSMNDLVRCGEEMSLSNFLSVNDFLFSSEYDRYDGEGSSAQFSWSDSIAGVVLNRAVSSTGDE